MKCFLIQLVTVLLLTLASPSLHAQDGVKQEDRLKALSAATEISDAMNKTYVLPPDGDVKIIAAIQKIKKANVAWWLAKSLSDSAMQERAEAIRKEAADFIVKTYGKKALPFIVDIIFQQRSRIVPPSDLTDKGLSLEDCGSIRDSANHCIKAMDYILKAYGKDGEKFISDMQLKARRSGDANHLVENTIKSVQADVDSVDEDDDRHP